MSVKINSKYFLRAVGTECELVFTYRTYGTGNQQLYYFLPTCRTYGTIWLQMVYTQYFSTDRDEAMLLFTNLKFVEYHSLENDPILRTQDDGDTI